MKPLKGFRLSLSISGSGAAGFPTAQVNQLTLQVVTAALGQGAGVVFGHDWRPDGVMGAVYAFAHQTELPAADKPLLQNLVPWPDRPILGPDDLERMAPFLRIEQPGLPPGLRPYENDALEMGPNHPLFDFLRARGLTQLRLRLTEICDARVCFGGPSRSQGRYPGIVEEALLAVEAGRPLFLAGLLGGTAAQLGDAILGQKMPEDFCMESRGRELYLNPVVREDDPQGRAGRTFDPSAVWRRFQKLGLQGLSASNGLSEAENLQLLQTPVIDRALALLLVGMVRLHRKKTSA